MHAKRTILLALAFHLPASIAIAAPDVDSARARATSVCAACHGANGVSVANHIPNLAAQRASYLRAQLQAFKDGSRKHEVMGAIAAQLSAGDMEGVAAYFAGQPAPTGDARSAPLPNLSTSRVTIPADFPAGFTRYQSITAPDGKSLTVRFANAVAIRAAKAGKPLPDGAAVIGVNYAAATDNNTRQLILGTDGQPLPGKVLSYVAMAREAGWGESIPAMLRNENWQYAMFNAEKVRRDGVNMAECYACHQPQVDLSYVFTLKLIAQANQGG